MPWRNTDRTRNGAGLAVVTLIAAVVLVMAITGFPGQLPVPKGTVFSRSDMRSWLAYFDVPAPGGRVLGAWTAYNVSFPPSLTIANGSLSSPPVILCPRFIVAVPELNGSVNRSVSSGPHTLYWSSCSFATRIVLTESIRLA